MEPPNNEEDPLAQHYCKNLRTLQSLHDGFWSICGFSCFFPEVSLFVLNFMFLTFKVFILLKVFIAQLIVFFVANIFFDNAGNYDVKSLEGIVTCILAFRYNFIRKVFYDVNENY